VEMSYRFASLLICHHTCKLEVELSSCGLG
jgi:hypothetical protein